MHSHSMPPMADQFVAAGHLPVDAFGNIALLQAGLDMQPDAMMMGNEHDRPSILHEYMKQTMTGADAAQMPNTSGNHY